MTKEEIRALEEAEEKYIMAHSKTLHLYKEEYVKNLQQENKQLKEQLEYLRSDEYYNQLRFERDMLQDLVEKGEVSKEDKTFIDCTHRNTELLEELEKEKRINAENKKTIDRQQEIIQESKDNWNKLKEYCKENLHFYSGVQNEDLETDTSIQGILDKMQDLESSDSDE